MLFNALFLTHCELSFYPWLLFLFLSLFVLAVHITGIALKKISVVVVLLWHQRRAQKYMHSSRCCQVGGNGDGWGHG